LLDRNLLRLNPTYRYCFKKGRKEARCMIAEKMLKEGYPMRTIVRITGLSKSDILSLH
jgi:hypothetical protein